MERLEAVPAHPRLFPLARSLQADVDRIARALEAAAEGDFRARTRVDRESPLSRIATAADRLIARNAQISREFNRVCRRVAVDGRLSERAHASILRGQYAAALFALNHLLDRLTWHAAEPARWRARWSRVSWHARCRWSLPTANRCGDKRCASRAA